MVQTIRANKTDLNKILKWSSSRCNEFKKSKVIDMILEDIRAGKDYRHDYYAGSFMPCGSMNANHYLFEIKDGKATITTEYDVYEIV